MKGITNAQWKEDSASTASGVTTYSSLTSMNAALNGFGVGAVVMIYFGTSTANGMSFIGSITETGLKTTTLIGVGGASSFTAVGGMLTIDLTSTSRNIQLNSYGGGELYVRSTSTADNYNVVRLCRGPPLLG